MENTIIAWTDYTFNPWMGCVKVSAGCKNCYAEQLTKNRMGLDLWGPEKNRQLTKSPWSNLRKWQKHAESMGSRPKVFCGSLCDWAEDHQDANRIRPALWDAIRQSPNMEFQMLTKRPENITKMLPPDWGDGYHNVWIGTTIECQDYAHRADILRDIPAKIRFVSYEPAIGPLKIDLNGLHWVIYGGESGPRYRPENKDWARSMLNDCRDNGVAFFHKQSAASRTEQGIELDGQIIREYPVVR